MLAIQNAVLRFLAVANIQAIKARLLQFCRKHTPRAEPTVQAPTEEEIREDDLYPATDDTEERFAAWESEQKEKVHQAEQLEQQGLKLLSRAALLRAAIKCDNRGDSFVGSELRELADNVGNDFGIETTTSDGTPILRLIGTDGPTKRGA
jgi:hypothetical protein